MTTRRMTRLGRMLRGMLLASGLLPAALLLAGCGSESKQEVPSTAQVAGSGPASLRQASEADSLQFQSGVVGDVDVAGGSGGAVFFTDRTFLLSGLISGGTGAVVASGVWAPGAGGSKTLTAVALRAGRRMVRDLTGSVTSNGAFTITGHLFATRVAQLAPTDFAQLRIFSYADRNDRNITSAGVAILLWRTDGRIQLVTLDGMERCSSVASGTVASAAAQIVGSLDSGVRSCDDGNFLFRGSLSLKPDFSSGSYELASSIPDLPFRARGNLNGGVGRTPSPPD